MGRVASGHVDNVGVIDLGGHALVVGIGAVQHHQRGCVGAKLREVPHSIGCRLGRILVSRRSGDDKQLRAFNSDGLQHCAVENLAS